MRQTETVVKDELEAAAVFDQVKAAVDAAEKSLKQINAADSESETATDSDLDSDEEVRMLRSALLALLFSNFVRRSRMHADVQQSAHS